MYILLENLQFIEIVHFLTLSWKYFHVIFLICSMSVDTFCPLRLPFLFIRPSGATSKGGRFLAGICSLPTLGGVANSHTWPQPHIMLGPSAVMPQSPLEWISLHGVGVNSACRCRTVAARLETVSYWEMRKGHQGMQYRWHSLASRTISGSSGPWASASTVPR